MQKQDEPQAFVAVEHDVDGELVGPRGRQPSRDEEGAQKEGHSEGGDECAPGTLARHCALLSVPLTLQTSL